MERQKEAQIGLKAKLTQLEMNETEYQRILNGPPDSVTMRSGMVRLAPGTSVGIHNTNSYEELIIVLEGKGEFRITGQEPLAIEYGTIAYCPPETEHNVINTGSSALRYIYVVAKVK
ncbi:MAG: cupin domain-containing protein [Candidatus Cloacimonadales bacterium]|nr:cupin domain-containing protein [Candidatus Cloacimonadales bacterium]